jgi:cytochrome b6-f complex iron-sulfur subunit
MSIVSNDSDRPAITPQQYEVLHGGGAEAAEIAKQRLSRRRFLRRSMLSVWGLSTVAAVSGSLYMLYPNLAGQFGADLTVGSKAKDFPAEVPEKFVLNSAGVFYHQEAKTYIVHIKVASQAPTLLQGQALDDQLSSETMVKDSDGSLWAALYQRCVHLGCTVPFRNDCVSFKCPCHGSHYNVSGEYIDGPAPRSLDRFPISFQGDSVVVSTGQIAAPVPHPDDTTRIIPLPKAVCGAG